MSTPGIAPPAPAGALTIRPARPADDETLWQMLCPVFRSGETYAIERDIDRASALAYWGGGGRSVFVAHRAGTACGTYYIGPNQRGGGAHVCNAGFVTAQPAQGSGVARSMLAHALDTGRAMGYRAMQFNFVLASNTRAVALWAAHGFAQVGRLPQVFDHPQLGLVDALVMHRFL